MFVGEGKLLLKLFLVISFGLTQFEVFLWKNIQGLNSRQLNQLKAILRIPALDWTK